jgi:RHH-type proline utilization regulon transcriptional repressor/proline dehydrogenase/delta 1-pyrroline-5-carboxylate dehydrogenase
VTAFANEPLLELRQPAVRASLMNELAALDERLPLTVPVLIDGIPRAGADFASWDPATPTRCVAEAAATRLEEVDAALKTARRAARDWAERDARDRAAVLAKAASILRARRGELAALEVRECAKPWLEADADVAEAIDFLEYYGQGAVRLAEGPELIQLPGERNVLRYAPRGVAAIVAPWNFPIAIAAGMSSAALAVGNAVVLKPAEQSPACGYALYQALIDGGVPSGALAFLPGAGETGAALVAHPDVDVVAFTGSAAVGLEILAESARVPAGQRHLKQTVIEMGGKNCIIVDRDADLDATIPAVVYSAFGFAGQKCSAASRLLVHEDVYDLVAERLAGAIEALRVGPASDFGTDVPPLIEQPARARVLDYAALGAREGRVLASASVNSAEGWYVAPTLVGELPADSRVLGEEIFGPLLAIERIASIDAALGAIDRLPWALTGGLFSRNPRVVRYVAERIPVGNFYVNRHITGAMAGRQPFGGNRLSGGGTKAGGPDYLLSFVEPRVVTENTVRHGLVV